MDCVFEEERASVQAQGGADITDMDGNRRTLTVSQTQHRVSKVATISDVPSYTTLVPFNRWSVPIGIVI